MITEQPFSLLARGRLKRPIGVCCEKQPKGDYGNSKGFAEESLEPMISATAVIANSPLLALLQTQYTNSTA